MKATLALNNLGALKSKILDPEYGTVELVFQAQMTPVEFGQFIEEYNQKEFSLLVHGQKTTKSGEEQLPLQR